MRNQRAKQRKALKAKKHRADYVRRKNINSNIPTIKVEEKKPRYRVATTERVDFTYNYKTKRRERSVLRIPITDRNGKQELEHIGYKHFIVKKLNPRYKASGTLHEPRKDEYKRDVGMIPYPPRRVNAQRDRKLARLNK
jgi:hypothetical protein